MGLGLFIAKTLLERSGAELSFANGSSPLSKSAGAGHPGGAIVEVVWPRSQIVASNPQVAVGANACQALFAFIDERNLFIAA